MRQSLHAFLIKLQESERTELENDEQNNEIEHTHPFSNIQMKLLNWIDDKRTIFIIISDQRFERESVIRNPLKPTIPSRHVIRILIEPSEKHKWHNHKWSDTNSSLRIFEQWPTEHALRISDEALHDIGKKEEKEMSEVRVQSNHIVANRREDNRQRNNHNTLND